ncbi:hypothetical protein RRG08_015728 [Elysia crispata]|uniref:Uncharacterized protein n=1 Tax=Elysia crispata TaxID=231223 RepID=A0AAE0Z6S7_9GAST|nr:hypothetical protein RRG08_015728 [Elysia crispata]
MGGKWMCWLDLASLRWRYPITKIFFSMLSLANTRETGNRRVTCGHLDHRVLSEGVMLRSRLVMSCQSDGRRFLGFSCRKDPKWNLGHL